MENVRLGIIGAGGIGTAHFHCVGGGKISGMTLAAVCDIDSARLDYCRSVMPDIPVFGDSRSLIKSGLVDAVLIAVPHRFHAEIAIDALNAGLHVLTEKPVDITCSAAEKLNKAAAESGRVFGIMFNQRTNPIYRKAREIVRSGQLGELKRSVWIITNWYRSQHYYDSGSWRATWAGEGGGVLLNQAPHNIDLWQWICGMPCEITAHCDRAKWHDIEVEDDATLFARYENGATGTFITSTGEYPGTNRLEITGTRGSVVVEQGRLTFRRLKTDEREVCFSSKSAYPDIGYETEVFEPQDAGTAHAGILKNFADAVLYGEKLLAPGCEGINQLRITNAAYLSSWTGNTIKIPCDTTVFDGYLRKMQEASKVKKLPEQPTRQSHQSYSERWKVKF